MKYEIIIGIDPDINESGVSVLFCNDKKIELSTWSFSDLALTMFRPFSKGKTLICVEAGFLNEKKKNLKFFYKYSYFSIKQKNIAKKFGDNKK